jgi:hypothetical protein
MVLYILGWYIFVWENFKRRNLLGLYKKQMLFIIPNNFLFYDLLIIGGHHPHTGLEVQINAQKMPFQNSKFPNFEYRIPLADPNDTCHQNFSFVCDGKLRSSNFGRKWPNFDIFLVYIRKCPTRYFMRKVILFF